MRVALVQMNSKDEKAENLERAEMLIAQAAAWGSDLVVLPELWTYLGPRSATRRSPSRFPGRPRSSSADWPDATGSGSWAARSSRPSRGRNAPTTRRWS